MTPEARREQLLTQVVGDELVVYDERTQAAHRLNPTAAVVWRLADGERSVDDLASQLRDALPADADAPPIDDEEGQALVRLALAELGQAGLLVRALPALGEPMTRRAVLKVAAVLLPVVASISAPTPAMAATTTTSTGIDLTPYLGTYSGSGTAGSPNTCGFGPNSLTITVTLPGGGSLTITQVHNTSPSPSTIGPFTGTVTPLAADSIRVQCSGTFSDLSVTEDLVFKIGPPKTVTGTKTFTSGRCTTVYNVSASQG